MYIQILKRCTLARNLIVIRLTLALALIGMFSTASADTFTLGNWLWAEPINYYWDHGNDQPSTRDMADAFAARFQRSVAVSDPISNADVNYGAELATPGYVYGPTKNKLIRLGPGDVIVGAIIRGKIFRNGTSSVPNPAGTDTFSFPKYVLRVFSDKKYWDCKVEVTTVYWYGSLGGPYEWGYSVTKISSPRFY